ncbi:MULTISPECIES: EscU/YscU/HrcU family type III secretion system export apparatus switch protein [Brevibacillus]|nr:MULTISPECIES: EscU/YscU/HrcU family type III secretion system export apparatus switch protein [Brevibacillus]MDR7315924.1 flagellar biosynthesis protein [Brevibacillus nitrificans]MED1794368.1 EscU/YscU/HrcU family type III secretion system export apparatus switch protein [Brevibacillus nitrificans]MED4909831.1 EscU/YscU/HrcU family type III secretion system export apparatus switch protein [Brevibacillus centrosporus]RNB88073.1 EscU/YscU/HrcU family type III secretion system export apparatus
MSQSQSSDSKRIQAVALKYQAGTMEAPKVVAKGKGYVAENMLKTAKEHDIPVQEDPSLVEVLGKLDLDQQIPPELYQVVAEILAFVYRLDKGGAEKR